ncbi:MAG TPA: 4'-phosphopantetheinyl transferase superfamily protein [Steroidobacteraceae bacterium]|nr:4'-phosphopantetheinyl transferase superfamily protein [Steroidobacteraceae bacterium]
MESGNIRASRLLGGLFTEGVVAFEARQPLGLETLHAEEAQYVARAVPKRVGEFAAGRACARRALAELAIADFPLRVGADREPLWPAGVTGSITHTAGFCGVVAARQATLGALGIDAELVSAVHRRLWRQIATREELRSLEGLPAAEADRMASILFSAKEAFFKCQFPLTRQWLNFADVRIRIEPHAFGVLPCKALALAGLSPPPWTGRYALEDSLIVTGLSLPARVLAGDSNSAGGAR